jgi:hypothetical protein
MTEVPMFGFQVSGFRCQELQNVAPPGVAVCGHAILYCPENLGHWNNSGCHNAHTHETSSHLFESNWNSVADSDGDSGLRDRELHLSTALVAVLVDRSLSASKTVTLSLTPEA